nr:MAG: hypothetical protein EDM05_31235 [Leptolyngbya sp. IPPAS B-1204]
MSDNVSDNVSDKMTYHPFDFDSPSARPATEYDTAARQSIPGYDALLSMVACLTDKTKKLENG